MGVVDPVSRGDDNVWTNAVPGPPNASETQRGILALATGAEATEGLDDTKAITAAGLASAIPVLSGSVSNASEAVRGIIELANQTEANALSDLVRAIAPGRLPLGSTSQRGLLETATTTEARTGTDGIRAVTPAGVRSHGDNRYHRSGSFGAATTSARGSVELATPAEAATGTDTDRAVTAAGVAAAIAALGSSPGNASEAVRGIIELATRPRPMRFPIW